MAEPFRFAYSPPTLVYGRDCVADLADSLTSVGGQRALVICGQTVGTTDSVIEPVIEGIGEKLVGVYAETTPDKRLRTAHDAAQRVREEEIDVLVALGGGSSLDIAAFTAILHARGLEYHAAKEEFVETGTITIPDETGLLPLVTVPSTLAGADLSAIAGITTIQDGELIRGMAFDSRILPAVIHYDPAVYETTPHQVLCSSAMNGFDKGVETLYSPNATPVTDGTAMRGLRLLQQGLPALGQGERDEETLYNSIVGTMLVQYGFTRATRAENQTTTVSLIHAFGHGIARGYDIQQGGAHGIIAPHALSFLFDNVDANRALLADALGIDTATMSNEAIAREIINTVTDIRDALGLPQQLRSISDMSKDDLPRIATSVHNDGLMPMTPEGFDPTLDEIEAVLEEAW